MVLLFPTGWSFHLNIRSTQKPYWTESSMLKTICTWILSNWIRYNLHHIYFTIFFLVMDGFLIVSIPIPILAKLISGSGSKIPFGYIAKLKLWTRQEPIEQCFGVTMKVIVLEYRARKVRVVFLGCKWNWEKALLLFSNWS